MQTKNSGGISLEFFKIKNNHVIKKLLKCFYIFHYYVIYICVVFVKTNKAYIAVGFAKNIFISIN